MLCNPRHEEAKKEERLKLGYIYLNGRGNKKDFMGGLGADEDGRRKNQVGRWDGGRGCGARLLESEGWDGNLVP